MDATLKKLKKCLAASLAGAVLGASGHAAWAAHSHAGSMDVYASVIPSQIIGMHLAQHRQPGITPHPPTDASLLVVALFDHRTGQRIRVAHITTRLRHGFLSRPAPDLEPLRLDQQPIFGHYLRFPAPGRYDVTLMIDRPGGKGSDSARLTFWQP